MNFSTADHTDTHGYAPLFWRLYGIDTGGLQGGWEHHSRPRPVTRAEQTFTNEPIVVHRPTFAVQIATSPGADVTGVCHTTKVDLVRSLGRRPRHRLTPEKTSPLDAPRELV